MNAVPKLDLIRHDAYTGVFDVAALQTGALSADPLFKGKGSTPAACNFEARNEVEFAKRWAASP